MSKNAISRWKNRLKRGRKLLKLFIKMGGHNILQKSRMSGYENLFKEDCRLPVRTVALSFDMLYGSGETYTFLKANSKTV